MSDVVRFGVSIDKGLLERFDRAIKEKDYPTRSKAIADLIREELVRREWTAGRDVTGAIVLAYDHHRRELVNRLMDIQHDFHDIVISSQHVHLDHDNCLEIVVVKGKSVDVRRLARRLKTTKGVKYCTLTPATTGKYL